MILVTSLDTTMTTLRGWRKGHVLDGRNARVVRFAGGGFVRG
jgi:hypothetical protein